jgi:undecaprenyl-diphosphatase
MYFSISVISFITLASYIYNYSSSNIVINQVVYQFFANISNDYGKHLMFYLTTLGQSYMVLLGSGAIIIYLLFSKQIRLVVHILGLLAMTLVTTTMLKNLTHSIRPTHIFKSYSFPSGHTTIATVFYGGLLLLVYKQLQPKTRKLALIITSFVIAGVAISRLYLGVHWLTDITGGFLLGISLLILSTMLYNRKPQPLSHNKNFISVMLMSCLVAYGVYAYSNRNELHRYLYKEPIPMKVKTLKSWYQQDADFLDSWHLNVLGFKSQKINIEWLGKINRICAILLDNGWKEPEPMAWSDIFFRLSGVKSAEHLPLIDPKYLDQPAKIIAIKRIKTNQLLVLRLWPANIHLHGTTDDLWVGVIAVVPRTYSWLSSKYNTTISPSEDLLFNPKVPSVNPYIPRPIVIKPGKKADIMLLK